MMKKYFYLRLFSTITTLLLSLAILTGCSSAAPSITLSQNGVAKQKIIVSPNATERTRQIADTLADYLGRISGGKFIVENGDGSSGIVVGIASDFPSLGLQDKFAPQDSFRRDEYILRSEPGKVLLIGATEIAVEHAIWDLLNRFGYRQFFPGETWEIIPKNPSLQIAVDTFEKPDFFIRGSYGYGHGMWPHSKKPYADWLARNRVRGGFDLETGHAYDAIIRKNPEVFKQHPEYLSHVDGKATHKFRITNPDLRKFVIDHYVLPHFKDNPNKDSVSLEPSDGGGWAECKDCGVMSSVTNRVVTLANEAAEALEKHYPGKYVGLLAYNLHSPPPTIKVNPHVLVKVYTQFIRGGFTFDQLIEGWKKQGATIGVGDYYSTFVSDYSRPASQKASDLYAIKNFIPKIHNQGALFFIPTVSESWGAGGLGWYLTSQLTWDTSKADQFDEIYDDFLIKSFGSAKKPMDGFFRLIYLFNEDDLRPMIREDMVARMYRFLSEAKELAGDDPQINARINDLILFTRYEELFQIMANSSQKHKQQTFETMVQHAYRMREAMMIHAKPIFQILHTRIRGVEQPSKEKVAINKPYTVDEINQILHEGIANTQVVDMEFKPKTFSRDLIPTTSLQLPEVEKGFYGGAPMGRQKFFTWLDVPGELRFNISGGHIKHYRNIASNVQTSLYADANPIIGEEVARDESVKPDGVENEVILKSTFEGLHSLEVYPPSNRAIIGTVDDSTPLTMEASIDYHNSLTSSWSLYFYVPKGTKVVGGFSSSRSGRIRDSGDNVLLEFSTIETPGYFKVDVPEGQDGKLWKFDRVTGNRLLMTVPPYLARNALELLLPKEVIKADTP